MDDRSIIINSNPEYNFASVPTVYYCGTLFSDMHDLVRI